MRNRKLGDAGDLIIKSRSRAKWQLLGPVDGGVNVLVPAGKVPPLIAILPQKSK